jgi:hypothetical protein
VMRKQSVIDALAKAATMPYYTLYEAEMHDLELLHCIRDLVPSQIHPWLTCIRDTLHGRG